MSIVGRGAVDAGGGALAATVVEARALGRVAGLVVVATLAGGAALAEDAALADAGGVALAAASGTREAATLAELDGAVPGSIFSEGLRRKSATTSTIAPPTKTEIAATMATALRGFGTPATVAETPIAVGCGGAIACVIGGGAAMSCVRTTDGMLGCETACTGEPVTVAE